MILITFVYAYDSHIQQIQVYIKGTGAPVYKFDNVCGFYHILFVVELLSFMAVLTIRATYYANALQDY